MSAKTRKTSDYFWASGIAVPIALSLLLYFFINSGLLFEKFVMLLFGPDKLTLFGRQLISTELFLKICLYGSDFLWGYSLMTALSLVLKKTVRGIKDALTIALIFEIIIGIFRVGTLTTGKFDLSFLPAEFLGNVLAFFSVLIHEKKLV